MFSPLAFFLSSRALAFDLRCNATLCNAMLNQPDLYSPLLYSIHPMQSHSTPPQYIHSTGLIHRDLKSMNIMIATGMCGKVADYGESRVQDNSMTMTSTGTPLWMAPEVSKSERYDAKADSFSFGIIIYEVRCGVEWGWGGGVGWRGGEREREREREKRNRSTARAEMMR